MGRQNPSLRLPAPLKPQHDYWNNTSRGSRLAVQASNEGLWDWDLTSGAFYLSPRLKEMLAIDGDDAEASRRGWFGQAHPEDRPGLLAEVSALAQGKRSSIFYEHRAWARDGPSIWVLCRALAVPGMGAPATRIVGSLTDVTERHLGTV